MAWTKRCTHEKKKKKPVGNRITLIREETSKKYGAIILFNVRTRRSAIKKIKQLAASLKRKSKVKK